jgi:hypothetical protein
VRVWVTLTSQRVIPRRRAIAAAWPERRIAGGSPGARTTSMSRHAMPWLQPVPSTFITASLAANRAA